MDIAALSMVMKQTNVQNDAGLAIMKIAMDTGKQTGNQISKMIENIAIDPNLGQHLDIRV